MIDTRRTTCWILLVLALSNTLAESQMHQDLLFHIKPVRQAFDEGTDITLEFSLKNVSKRRVLATREASLHDLIYLEIVDQAGKQVGWRGPITSRGYAANFFVILEPGQSTTFRSVISFSDGRGYNLQKPGTYRVRAEFSISPKAYFAPVADGAVIPDNPVRSNWAKLVITARSTRN